MLSRGQHAQPIHEHEASGPSRFQAIYLLGLTLIFDLLRRSTGTFVAWGGSITGFRSGGYPPANYFFSVNPLLMFFHRCSVFVNEVLRYPPFPPNCHW